MPDRGVRAGAGGSPAQNPGAQALVNACFMSGGTSRACERVTGFGTGDITAIDAGAINIGKFLTRGDDFEVGYNMPMSAGGNLNVRFIATYPT